jgi:sulfate permease, SulP family
VLVTALATVALDLITAVEIGVVIAVVVVLTKLARTARLIPDDTLFELADAEEHDLLRRHVLVYRLDGPLSFGAAARFLAELTAGTDVRVVVLRLLRAVGAIAALDRDAHVLPDLTSALDHALLHARRADGQLAHPGHDREFVTI